MTETLAEMFKPRQDLVNRLKKTLERVHPDRHLLIVTSWMSEDDLRKLVEFQENNPI